MRSPFATVMLKSVVSSSSFRKKAGDLGRLCGGDASPSALDFMERCMSFNPEERCSARSALEHPFVVAFHNSEYEPEFKGTIDVRTLILDIMCT